MVPVLMLCIKIIQAVEEMKTNISQFREDIKDAKKRHEEANRDAKRIERDMSEFNDNKDSKLSELQKSLDALKKDLTKNSTSIRPLQQKMREAKLESEQCGSDLAAAQEELAESTAALRHQKQEIDEMVDKQRQIKVSHEAAHGR